ncbi:MAG: hypothetical protein JW726_00235 [Anaerolineales bacterium]|nr:hypothetical protein [Anaerolineales bacterium]
MAEKQAGGWPASARWQILWHKLLQFAWAAALVTLPLTSFPPLKRLTGALVAPAAALPVLFLLVFWLFPRLLRGGSLPRETVPIVIFALIAALASAAVFFIETPSYKGQSLIGREGRSFLTLAIGLAFYLVFASWNRDLNRLQTTWRWLTIGGIAMLAWSLVQAYFVVLQNRLYPNWLEAVQETVAVKMPHPSLWGLRVDSLAYEPSWFSHQMVMLYLPLWFAATFQKTSAFRFRILRLSLENILLAVSLVVFFLARPRVSILSLLLILLFFFVKINLAIYRRLLHWIQSLGWFRHQNTQIFLQRAVAYGTILVMIGLYAGILAGAVMLTSKLDPRVLLLLERPPSWQEIWRVITLDEDALLYIGWRMAFMERIVYWVTGWHVFHQHPWLGVGLGNAGFFFKENVPAMGWASWEVRELLNRLPTLPNIKSMWVRLMAESGIAGLSVFLGWFYLQIQSAWKSIHSDHPALKTLALTGLLGLIAYVAEGFSIDSFAMPYLWVAAGLTAAAGALFRQELRQASMKGTS